MCNILVFTVVMYSGVDHICYNPMYSYWWISTFQWNMLLPFSGWKVSGLLADQPEKLKPLLLTNHLAGMCKWCLNKL